MTRGKEVLIQSLRTGDDEIELRNLFGTALKERSGVLNTLLSIENDILEIKEATKEDIIESIALLKSLESGINDSIQAKHKLLISLKQEALDLLSKLRNSRTKNKVPIAMKLGGCREKIKNLEKSLIEKRKISRYIPNRIQNLEEDFSRIEIEIKQLKISIMYREKSLRSIQKKELSNENFET